jgi:hypothetical protein
MINNHSGNWIVCVGCSFVKVHKAKAWPQYLEDKLTHISDPKFLINEFTSGGNDLISKSVIKSVSELLESGVKSDHINVYIMWSDVARKDFLINEKDIVEFQDMDFDKHLDAKFIKSGGANNRVSDIDHYKKTSASFIVDWYKKYYSEEERFYSTLENILRVQNFLNDVGVVKYSMMCWQNIFNYRETIEEKPPVLDDVIHFDSKEAKLLKDVYPSTKYLWNEIDFSRFMFYSEDGYEYDGIAEHNVRNNIFLNVSHPTEEGHRKWTDYIYEHYIMRDIAASSIKYIQGLDDYIINCELKADDYIDDDYIKSLNGKLLVLEFAFRSDIFNTETNIVQSAIKYADTNTIIFLVKNQEYDYSVYKGLHLVSYQYTNTGNIKVWKEDVKIVRNKSNSHKERKFLSLNRGSNPHRIKLIKELKSRDLYNKGFISDTDTAVDGTKFVPLSESNIDYVNSTRENELKYYFDKTYFSIVTETYNLMDTNVCSLSEKTYRCFYMKHPFYIIGHKNSLKCLKKEGFKTFSNVFDESYDELDTWQERLEFVLNDVERVLGGDIEMAMHKLRRIVDYNYFHYCHNNKSLSNTLKTLRSIK